MTQLEQHRPPRWALHLRGRSGEVGELGEVGEVPIPFEPSVLRTLPSASCNCRYASRNLEAQVEKLSGGLLRRRIRFSILVPTS